jgi:hypothetical protein
MLRAAPTSVIKCSCGAVRRCDHPRRHVHHPARAVQPDGEPPNPITPAPPSLVPPVFPTPSPPSILPPVVPQPPPSSIIPPLPPLVSHPPPPPPPTLLPPLIPPRTGGQDIPSKMLVPKFTLSPSYFSGRVAYLYDDEQCLYLTSFHSQQHKRSDERIHKMSSFSFT